MQMELIENRIAALDIAIKLMNQDMARNGIVDESHIEYASYATAVETLWTLRLEFLVDRAAASSRD
jgi:hypothetical protein